MNKWIVSIIIAAILGGIFVYLRMNPSILEQSALKPTMPVAQITNSAMLEPTGFFEVEGADTEYFGNVTGYFARPAGEGDYPGVVMVHEWWGLNDNIKDMARKLASEGYMVLAVDLYNGKVASSPDDARKYVSAVDQKQANENMKAAYDFLKSRQAAKVASLGWCFGGGKSLALAVSGVPLSATVLYYGTPLITDPNELSAIKWPVHGVFGNKDQAIPVEKVKEFEAALDQNNIENEIYVYPGVGHAFANPTGQNYAAQETKDAWAKTLAFLKKNLK